MKWLKVEIYGQFIKLESDNYEKLAVFISGFLHKLMVWNIKKTFDKKTRRNTFERIVEKVFFIEERKQPGISRSCDCLRIPRALENELLDFILNKQKMIENDKIDVIYMDPIKGEPIDIKFRNDITLRDYQEAYVQAIVKNKKNNILVDLYTGYGKTMIAMNAITRIGKKFCVAILPTYIPKWIGDITSLTNIKEEEILVLKGTDSLLNLLEMEDKELNKYKAFILSLPTMHNFIKLYLEGELSVYGDIHPEMVFEKMKIEVLLNDEGHQHFHQVVETALFANVRLMLILTATLITNNRALNRIYKLIIPDNQRINNIVEYEPYMYVIAIAYKFKNPKTIKYKTTQGYSQVKLEQSIMKKTDTLNNYLRMIDEGLKEYYLKKKKKEEEKVLIYAGTVAMCSKIRDYLKEKHPELRIAKYTEEDPYEVILENQVIVSTIQSAGVALDIPNLITVLQTVNMDSPAANEQARGRLRRLKDNNTWYVMFWSPDIPQHLKYLKNRIQLFRGKVKEFLHKKYGELI